MKFHFLGPLLHPFLAQSLPRSLPPSRRPCHAPFLPRLFPSSTLPPSTLPSSTDASCPCSVLASSLPPLTLSLPPSFSPSLPLFPLPPSPCSLPPSPPSFPPSVLPHLLFSLAPSLSHIIASSLPPAPCSLRPPPTFYSPALLPCPSLNKVSCRGEWGIMAPSGHMAPPEISAIWCCHLFDKVDTSTSAHAQTVTIWRQRL